MAEYKRRIKFENNEISNNNNTNANKVEYTDNKKDIKKRITRKRKNLGNKRNIGKNGKTEILTRIITTHKVYGRNQTKGTRIRKS